jgi:hypothetical protein
MSSSLGSASVPTGCFRCRLISIWLRFRGVWACARRLGGFGGGPGGCRFPGISRGSGGVVCGSRGFVGGRWFARSVVPGPGSVALGARVATQANSSGTTRQFVINFPWGSYSMFAQFFWSRLRRATAHKVPIFAT